MKLLSEASRAARLATAGLTTAAIVAGLAISPAAFAWGVDTVKGSGVIQSQTRQLDSFDTIELTDSSDLDIHIGSPQSVVVEADDNLIDRIKTHVSGGALVVESKGSYSSIHPVKVHITVASLSKLDISGSGDASVSSLTGKAVVFSVEGSGDIIAKGLADQITVTVGGSGDVDLHELAATRAQVRIDGSGDVRVHASQSLDATINGSGDIRYSGMPAQLKTRVNGSGDITRE